MSALWTQLQRDAWVSLPGPQDSALRSELNYPSDPRSFSSPLLVLPFLHSAKPSHFTLHGATLFFLLPYYTPRTITSKMLQFLLCSMLDLEVHYMLGWKFITLLRSGTIPPPACQCTLKHFPSCSDWKGCQCLWHRPHSSLGYCCYACARSF